MAQFKRGDVVLLPFPFSDATGAKRRPAPVLAELPFYGGMDYLICMIFTQKSSDPHSIELQPSDLVTGRLTVQSYLGHCTSSERKATLLFGELEP